MCLLPMPLEHGVECNCQVCGVGQHLSPLLSQQWQLQWKHTAKTERGVPAHSCGELDNFKSLYRLPSHVMYISQSLYWCCLFRILTCSACLWCTCPVAMHTIHMRCCYWASITCRQSPAQGLWVVITDGTITYSRQGLHNHNGGLHTNSTTMLEKPPLISMANSPGWSVRILL